MNRPQIVVGIDGSTMAHTAMCWAAAEAERRGAQLVLAHAADAETDRSPYSAAPTRYSHELLVDAEVYSYDADCPVSTVVAPEDPVRLLTWLSEQADLVVVGAHGRGQQAGRQLGSVAFGMAVHARCPVAVIPYGWHEEAQYDKPVVVGIPASVASRTPLYVAFAEARARGVPVRAVRAWSRVDWTGNLTDLIHPASPMLEAKQQDYLERVLTPVCELYPDVTVQTVLSGKRVDDVMLTATADAGLLVLGSRYADGRAYSRLGATTARLMQKIPCPTIVIGRVQARASSVDATAWSAIHSAG